MAAQTRRALRCLSLRSLIRAGETPTVFTAIALAALASASPLAAAETPVNPGHAIAQHFAEDTERARAAEAAKKDTADKAAAMRRKQATEKAAKDKAEKAWEAEMLSRARREAEERRQLEAEAARLDALRMAREAKEAEAARKAEEARVADEKRKTEDMHRAAEALRKAAVSQRITEEKDREARRVEAERLAEQARRAQNERLAEEGRRAEAQRIEAARKAEEAARLAEAARRAEQITWAAEEKRRAEQIRQANEALRIAAQEAEAEKARRADEAQRAIARATDEETRRVGALETDAEVERVATRLRKIREQYIARHMPPEAPSLTPSHAPDGAIGRLGAPPKTDITRAPAPDEAAEIHQAADAPSGTAYYGGRHDGRVTVLLQMEPSGRPGRRHESMDPILCLTDGCYVSNGPHHPASFLPGHKATRFGNAIGRRAGACNRAYTCVFRDVEMGPLPAEVQPVDIRILRHDRRSPESVDALSICRDMQGRLACTGAIHGDGYTMWVIPETSAAHLPIDLFGSTLESGLGHEPRAELAPRRSRW